MGLARALPTDVALPPVRSVLVLLLVPALCAASALLALRQVEATPLGVSRRAQPAPRAGGFALLLVGLALLPAATVVNGGFVLVPIAVVLIMLGVTAAASWLTARVGTLAARRARRPALLLAGRRLQADPRAQGRALSGVVLAVLVAAAAAVPRADALQISDDNDEFYRSAYALVDLALLVALVVAAAGLLVASCEAVLERRRTLASLAAAGVPLGTLRRAVLLQSLLPAVPAVTLALVVGAGFTLAPAVLGFVPIPWARLLGVLVLALLAVTAASAATLPLLRRAVRPTELRQT
jgi:hypothetical protein